GDRSTAPLPSLFDPVPQEVIQVRNVVDFFRGRSRVVIHTTKRQLSRFLDDIARSWVTITRLPYGPDVAHKLLLLELVTITGFIWRHEVAAFGEHAWHVCVTLKASELHHTEELLNLLLVVDVFRKDVFVYRIA